MVLINLWNRRTNKAWFPMDLLSLSLPPSATINPASVPAPIYSLHCIVQPYGTVSTINSATSPPLIFRVPPDLPSLFTVYWAGRQQYVLWLFWGIFTLIDQYEQPNERPKRPCNSWTHSVAFPPAQKWTFFDPAVSFTFAEACRNIEIFVLLSNLAERN